MKQEDYLGNYFQLFGVEEYTLNQGRGKGCEIYHVKNGLGLEMCINISRGFDITSLTYKGTNLSYLTPNGYVNPQYYDNKDAGFLKSFTAGFLTTCGLTQVGSPNVDNGEVLPLHGTYSHIPCANSSYKVKEDEIILEAEILDEEIFSHKLKLIRTIRVSRKENSFTIEDEVINEGDQTTPYEILYHMNMGYPLLCESSILVIPSNKVVGRNEYAQSDIANWGKMEVPTANYEEKCYYHFFDNGECKVSIFNPKINIGLSMAFDHEDLNCFTEWKMMGKRDYVLGLEPGNCYPDGRNVMREKKLLKFLKPDQIDKNKITIKVFEK